MSGRSPPPGVVREWPAPLLAPVVQPPRAAPCPQLRGPPVRWLFCGAGVVVVPPWRIPPPRPPTVLPRAGWPLPRRRSSLRSGAVSPLGRPLVHAGPWLWVWLSHPHPTSISASPSEGWGYDVSPSLPRQGRVHPPLAFRLSPRCPERSRPIGAGAGAAAARHRSRSPRSGTPLWVSPAVRTPRVELEPLRFRNSAVKLGFGFGLGRLGVAAEDGSAWPGPLPRVAPRGPMLLRSYRNPFPWGLAPPVGGASRVWRWPTLRLRLGHSSIPNICSPQFPHFTKWRTGLRDEDICYQDSRPGLYLRGAAT